MPGGRRDVAQHRGSVGGADDDQNNGDQRSFPERASGELLIENQRQHGEGDDEGEKTDTGDWDTGLFHDMSLS
jgi:hypothetical protein